VKPRIVKTPREMFAELSGGRRLRFESGNGTSVIGSVRRQRNNFTGSTEYEPGGPPEGFGAGMLPAAYTLPSNGSRVWQVITDFGWLSQGTRLRATMSWDTCTEDPLFPRVDFDLFLFRRIETAGEHVLMAGWSPGSGCNGSQWETFGWAWAIVP
jgi:hypothetical protein